MALLPVDQALQRLLDGAEPADSEQVSIGEAAGRVLAEEVRALRTQPPFDASAMDGYAVRAADIETVPVTLDVIGQAPAGQHFPGMVGPGQAVRIFTGAPVPPGADTVVIQENTRLLDNGAVEIVELTAGGRNIRLKGLDFSTGDLLLEKGWLLDAGAVSLAAAANHPTLSVLRRPLLAIIATGDELLPPGSEPGPDQIIASNGYGVAAIARSVGAEVLDLGIVSDSLPAISSRIRHAIEQRADVIVTLGGASVGDHDLTHDALVAEGMTLGFWKIAMRPGKPLMFGRRGTTRFLGFPGNPVASLVCSHLFLKPLLSRLGGRAFSQDIRDAVLDEPMAANDLRQDYVRAMLHDEPDGRITATPFATQDSSMLKTFSQADGLIIREPFAPAAEAGSICKVLRLR